ncbi:hypothetical protein Aduo_019819 [Ancylostoma duodenale]
MKNDVFKATRHVGTMKTRTKTLMLPIMVDVSSMEPSWIEIPSIRAAYAVGESLNVTVPRAMARSLNYLVLCNSFSVPATGQIRDDGTLTIRMTRAMIGRCILFVYSLDNKPTTDMMQFNVVEQCQKRDETEEIYKRLILNANKPLTEVRLNNAVVDATTPRDIFCHILPFWNAGSSLFFSKSKVSSFDESSRARRMKDSRKRRTRRHVEQEPTNAIVFNRTPRGIVDESIDTVCFEGGGISVVLPAGLLNSASIFHILGQCSCAESTCGIKCGLCGRDNSTDIKTFISKPENFGTLNIWWTSRSSGVDSLLQVHSFGCTLLLGYLSIALSTLI